MVGGYPSKEHHNGGRANKTILSQPSPSEDQQQLHVVVKAGAADECTRMAHTKNKKLPKMARRISFQPNPAGRASWSHGLGFSQLCALVEYLASGPSRGGPAPRRLYSTAKKVPCCRPSDCGNLQMVLFRSPPRRCTATAMHPLRLLSGGCGQDSMRGHRAYVKNPLLNSNWP